MQSARSREIVPPVGLPAPRFRYSPVVRVGAFVYVSGLVGLDESTGELAPGGAYGETAQILRNLGNLCDSQGWTLAQLIVARIYCGPRAEAKQINRAWGEAFADIVPPARSFVGVQSLPLDAAVEIEFQLAV